MITKSNASMRGFKKFEENSGLDTLYYKPIEDKPKSYDRDWASYNKAQTSEKFMFLRLLSESVNSLNVITYTTKQGRPPLQLSDMLKSCCIKVFNNFSARRNYSDIEIAYLMKYLIKKPHYNSLINYMNNPNLTPFLHKLIKITSEPLYDYENDFSIDGTGISTFCKDKWVNVRVDFQKHHDYKKLHAICGNNTNIIASARVTEGRKSDCPLLPELLKDATDRFDVKRVMADKGYLSRKNTQVIEDAGAIPFIMPKKNTISKSYGYPAWNRMVWMFKKHPEKFKKYYHKRSNVESTFSMMKRKFSPFIRSRKTISQENEVLCMVVCHNISVLVNCIFELNLDVNFEK